MAEHWDLQNTVIFYSKDVASDLGLQSLKMPLLCKWRSKTKSPSENSLNRVIHNFPKFFTRQICINWSFPLDNTCALIQNRLIDNEKYNLDLLLIMAGWN
jgi:hypothetical protein